MVVRRSEKLKDRPFERVTRLLCAVRHQPLFKGGKPLTTKNLSQSLCGVSEEFVSWCVCTLGMYGKHWLRRKYWGISESSLNLETILWSKTQHATTSLTYMSKKHLYY